MIRLLALALAIVPATLWYAGRITWATSRKRPDAMCVCDDAVRSWARLLLRIAGVRVVLENAEVIDDARPQILVANHLSWFDVLALSAYLPGKYVFVAKQEVSRVPVFGAAAAACGHIYIDRGDRNAAVGSLAMARKTLEEMRPTVIMFPEGTRSPTGALQPFKKGAFVLAIQAGVDVVPAAIHGTREIMRKGSFFIRPGTIRVRFGEEISVKGYDFEERNGLTQAAWSAVDALRAGLALPESESQGG